MGNNTLRTVDDISSDFANTENEEERARLTIEMDAISNEIAGEHLAAGNITEYQSMIGR